MSKKVKITFQCPCEQEHQFEEIFKVSGEGKDIVQVHCPHPKCPSKNPMLSFEIPWKLEPEIPVFRKSYPK
jgi:hypothetical protein